MTQVPVMSAKRQAPFILGDWTVSPEIGRLSRGDESVSLEPKVMALLVLLAEGNGTVFSRADIEAALWPDVIVGEDTVARTVSKLRRALGDKAQNPVYLETIPKKGYRLLVASTPAGSGIEPALPVVEALRHRGWLVGGLTLAALVAGVWVLQPGDAPIDEYTQLTERADDLYMQFTQADNEAAIALYERVLAGDSNNTRAQAGLANALVQRVIRWPGKAADGEVGASTLQDALKRGLNQSVEAQEIMGRATAMAERAARLAPQDPDILKALGLAYATSGRIDDALAIYQRAIDIDGNAWEAMINLGEIYQIKGERTKALAMFERAYEAMDRSYLSEPQRIGPWQAALGVLIGKLREEEGALQEAEIWYRRVLGIAPLQVEGTTRLASLLIANGDREQALSLCRNLVAKVGDANSCAAILQH